MPWFEQLQIALGKPAPLPRRQIVGQGHAADARAVQGLDAVAEAIAVDDSQWRRITLERGDACRDGAVIVHIMEAEA